MRKVREWRHVFHEPIAWDLDKRVGGSGSGGGWIGARMHPGRCGFGEVGSLDGSIEGGKIRLGVVSAERGVCFKE